MCFSGGCDIWAENRVCHKIFVYNWEVYDAVTGTDWKIFWLYIQEVFTVTGYEYELWIYVYMYHICIYVYVYIYVLYVYMNINRTNSL